MPISLDLHMTITKISEKDGIDDEQAIEAGAFVAANFMRSILKNKVKENKGSLSREEINAVFENIAEFYSESFGERFSQSDFDFLTDRTMEIVMAQNSETMIAEYFGKIMKP